MFSIFTICGQLWPQLLNTKNNPDSHHLLGVWNLPHKYHLYLIFYFFFFHLGLSNVECFGELLLALLFSLWIGQHDSSFYWDQSHGHFRFAAISRTFRIHGSTYHEQESRSQGDSQVSFIHRYLNIATWKFLCRLVFANLTWKAKHCAWILSNTVFQSFNHERLFPGFLIEVCIYFSHKIIFESSNFSFFEKVVLL